METGPLTPAAELAYRRICDHVLATNDHLKFTRRTIRQLAKADRSFDRIWQELSTARDDQGRPLVSLRHDAIDDAEYVVVPWASETLAKTENLRSQRSDAGKASAEAQRRRAEEPDMTVTDPTFESFWKEWPGRKHKDAAREQWAGMMAEAPGGDTGAAELAVTIIQGLRRYISTAPSVKVGRMWDRPDWWLENKIYTKSSDDHEQRWAAKTEEGLRPKYWHERMKAKNGGADSATAG